jgi:peptidyl-prolyl cis-trans isomerase-like 3
MSMANSGPNTNGCQFFITYVKQPHLNGHYTIFVNVIDGLTEITLKRVTVHANPIAG